MAWLEGLSSLRNQLTNITRDVLAEAQADEEPTLLENYHKLKLENEEKTEQIEELHKELERLRTQISTDVPEVVALDYSNSEASSSSNAGFSQALEEAFASADVFIGQEPESTFSNPVNEQSAASAPEAQLVFPVLREVLPAVSPATAPEVLPEVRPEVAAVPPVVVSVPLDAVPVINQNELNRLQDAFQNASELDQEGRMAMLEELLKSVKMVYQRKGTNITTGATPAESNMSTSASEKSDDSLLLDYEILKSHEGCSSENMLASGTSSNSQSFIRPTFNEDEAYGAAVNEKTTKDPVVPGAEIGRRTGNENKQACSQDIKIALKNSQIENAILKERLTIIENFVDNNLQEFTEDNQSEGSYFFALNELYSRYKQLKLKEENAFKEAVNVEEENVAVKFKSGEHSQCAQLDDDIIEETKQSKLIRDKLNNVIKLFGEPVNDKNSTLAQLDMLHTILDKKQDYLNTCEDETKRYCAVIQLRDAEIQSLKQKVTEYQSCIENNYQCRKLSEEYHEVVKIYKDQIERMTIKQNELLEEQSKYENHVEQLNETIHELTEKLSEKRDEEEQVKLLALNLSEQEVQFTEFRERENQYKKDHEQLNEKIRTLSTELAKCQAENESMKKLESSLYENTARLDEYKRMEDERDARVTEFIKEISILARQFECETDYSNFNAYEGKDHSKIDELIEIVQVLLERTVARKKLTEEENMELKTQLAEYKRIEVELEARVKTLTESIHSYDKQLELSHSKDEEYELQIQQLFDEVRMYENFLTKNERNIIEYKSQNDQCAQQSVSQQQPEECDGKTDEQEKKGDTLVEDCDKQITDYRQKFEESEKMVENLSAKNKELIERIDELTNQVDVLKKSKDEIEEAHKLEYEKLTSHVDKVTESLNKQIQLKFVLQADAEEWKSKAERFQHDLEAKYKAMHDVEAKLYEQNIRCDKAVRALSDMELKYEKVVTTLKEKHAESLYYHKELEIAQTKLYADEEAIEGLKKKIRELEQTLSGTQQSTNKLERLQKHLLEMEQTYTNEVVAAEAQVNEYKKKVASYEERIKTINSAYTSINIRMNQQTEEMQRTIKALCEERDRLLNEVNQARSKIERTDKEVQNLRAALDLFQKNKISEIQEITDKLKAETVSLRKENESLRATLENSENLVENLKSLELENAKFVDAILEGEETINALKKEVNAYKAKLTDYESKAQMATGSKSSDLNLDLIKNLTFSYLTANSNMAKQQALQILSDILHFSDQQKLVMRIPVAEPPVNKTAPGRSNKSLVQEFIQYVDKETNGSNQPAVPDRRASQDQATSLLTPESMLPTLPQFPVGHNSSGILKDVLSSNDK